MWRRILSIIFLVAGLSGTAAAQPANPWAAWVEKSRGALEAKDKGITVSAWYRDHVCSRQTTADKRGDCESRLNTIIDRRKKEKSFLLATFEATKLATEAREIILPVLIQAYGKMNDDTLELAKEAFKLYPQRQ